MNPAALNNKSADTTNSENAEPVENLLSIGEQMPDFGQWLPEGALPAWQMINAYPWMGAIVVAALFYIAAIIVRATLFKLLGRLSNLTESSADDRVLEYLKPPVFTTIFFTGLTIAVVVSQLSFGKVAIQNILLSVIAFSWMKALFNIATTALNALAYESRFNLIETRTVPMFDITLKLLIILVGSYTLLMIWGVNPVGWLASAGIVGIAVGFAAKDTLANLFSGFFIVADAPYKIGDYINLDTGERGKVNAIGLRSTRLLTRDDVEVTIPNGVIASAKIVNESGGQSPKMRIRVDVGAAYGSDVDQVCELLQKIGNAHTETCKTPEPRVRMRAFGASSLDFQLMCWIEHPQDRGRITHELLMEIYKVFDHEGVEIPFSKHDIYIKEMPAQAQTQRAEHVNRDLNVQNDD